jgi:hypothetical protein
VSPAFANITRCQLRSDERRRINNAAGVFVENFNRRAIQQARSQGVEVPSPMIGTSENIIGMDVDPTEWDPELFIPCQVCRRISFLNHLC